MRFLHSRPLSIIGAVILIGSAVYLINQTLNPKIPDWTTATVEKGSVSELVSVSGFVEAKRVAELAFPSTGVVTDVLVTEGSEVKKGDILATLAAAQLVAERNEAVSALNAAQASYSQTVAGPRNETIAVANTSLRNAEENLNRVTTEEGRKVANALSALLSIGLTAVATDPDEDSVPPVISGTYSCSTEGSYSLAVYSSSGKSGYSYNYTGLEKGTGSVSFEQPAPIGDCGLYLLFTEGTQYNNSKWVIEVPNTRGASYTTLNNSYKLAQTQAKNAIANAEDALALVTKENILSTAPSRSTEVTQSSAAVGQALARIAAIDAKITDRSIVAPFDGIVTDVNITTGESAPLNSVITLLASNDFTLKARIPEIDITKLAVGQIVRSVFDAQSKDTVLGKITYISPIAKQIDGVAYFETIVELDTSPEWLRAGLNADVDIIIENKQDVLRIPKRFVITLEDGTRAVLTPNGNKTATTTVEVIFTGNDSFLEISGLTAGTVVVAP